MSAIGQINSAIAGTYGAAVASKTTASSKTTKTEKYGNTIGQPELSDKAAEYYDKLKEKYSDMDFVLVSNDEVENAEQKASKYAKADRTLVLIDADKVEEMASDEDVREKYEGIIGNAGTQLNQLKETLGDAIGNVKTFGIKVNDDGTTSYFAVVDKSLAAQKERIEKNAEKKAEEKAKTAKKEKAQKQKEKLETISASSMDELAKKLQDRLITEKSDNVQTDEEKKVGTQFDISI